MEDKIIQDFLTSKEPEQKKTALANFADTAVDKTQAAMKATEQAEQKDFREGSKDIAHIMATADAMDKADESNKKFLNEVKGLKQEEIKQSFQSEKYKEEAKKLEAKKQKAEAFYNSFRPVLEFDFGNLIPEKAKTKLFHKKDEPDTEPIPQEKHKITYQDRSYGIPLMVIMLILLVVPYCTVTVILAIFRSVNAIFDCIARFGKPALIICGTVMIIALMLLGSYCLCMGIDKLFGTNILTGILP